MLITAIREVQIPLLSAMLLGGCAAKMIRTMRMGSADAGLGPTALFPMRLRLPLAVAICVIELGLGIGLIVTAGNVGSHGPANVVRMGTGLLFLVATCALLELRGSRPDLGCGCFGEFSTAPVSGRALARSALLTVAAAITVGLPPLRLHQPGSGAALLLGILAAELAIIGALSPELGEGLVRLGYSEPCELRNLGEERTLSALRRSAQWRKHSDMITALEPTDMWRELCWRYVVFPTRYRDRQADIVFAVYLRPRRPPVQSALVDTATGDTISWPVSPARRRSLPQWARLTGLAGGRRASSAGRARAGAMATGSAADTRPAAAGPAAAGHWTDAHPDPAGAAWDAGESSPRMPAAPGRAGRPVPPAARQPVAAAEPWRAIAPARIAGGATESAGSPAGSAAGRGHRSAAHHAADDRGPGPEPWAAEPPSADASGPRQPAGVPDAADPAAILTAGQPVTARHARRGPADGLPSSNHL